jgi:hypothetical protein
VSTHQPGRRLNYAIYQAIRSATTAVDVRRLALIIGDTSSARAPHQALRITGITKPLPLINQDL